MQFMLHYYYIIIADVSQHKKNWCHITGEVYPFQTSNNQRGSDVYDDVIWCVSVNVQTSIIAPSDASSYLSNCVWSAIVDD